MPQYTEEEEQYPRAIGAYMPDAPSEDFFKFRVDGSDILEEIEHQLKGEVYNPETKKYELKFDRWINDEGINKVMHIIFACGINKNAFLGNLTTDQINQKCESIWRDLALLLFKKYKDYEVKKEMRSLLVKSVVFPIHSALSRSESGREASQISTAAQRVEMFQHQEHEQKSSGALSRFGLFKRPLVR